MAAQRRLVILNGNVPKVLILDRSVPDIKDFSPSITDTLDQAGRAVWGTDTGELIVVMRRQSGTSWRFYHLETSAGPWIDKGQTPGNAQVWEFRGTSYSDIWAVLGDAARIVHFDGNTWVEDANVGGTRLVSVSVVGTALDGVFALGYRNIWFRQSGAYGSGVWADQWSTMTTDTGIAPGAPTSAKWIYAVSKTEIYIGLVRGSNWQVVVKWNGATWSIVATSDNESWESSGWGRSGSKIWWKSDFSQWASFFNGSTITHQTQLVGTSVGGDLVMCDDLLGYAVARDSPNQISLWETTNGSTWTRIVLQAYALTSQDGGLGLWRESTPPVLQNQNPAPSASGVRGDDSLYLEVVDGQDDLVASTVQIWVNGNPAWSGSSAEPGWGGARGAVTTGFSYTFRPDNPLPVGTNTIRVRAVDDDDNTLDTEYTFETAIFLDSVSPDPVSERGGTVLTMTGLFLKGEGVAVTLEGEPCYGGSGKGYSPSSEDGITLKAATPPLTPPISDGGSLTLQVVAASATRSLPLIVIERNWGQDEFEMNRRFPPKQAAGARRLELEDLIQFPG